MTVVGIRNRTDRASSPRRCSTVSHPAFPDHRPIPASTGVRSKPRWCDTTRPPT